MDNENWYQDMLNAELKENIRVVAGAFDSLGNFGGDEYGGGSPRYKDAVLSLKEHVGQPTCRDKPLSAFNQAMLRVAAAGDEAVQAMTFSGGR